MYIEKWGETIYNIVTKINIKVKYTSMIYMYVLSAKQNRHVLKTIGWRIRTIAIVFWQPPALHFSLF